MTGYSYNKEYIKSRVSFLLIVGGTALLLEHLFCFVGFDIELIGHEYYGLIMIIVGFLLSVKWKQLPGIIEALKKGQLIEVLDEGTRNV